MPDFVRLMLPPLLCGLTGLLYYYSPVRTVLVMRAGIVAALIVVLGLGGTGIFSQVAGWLHELLGRGFVIAMWLMVPAAAGVSIAAAVRSRLWFRLLHVILPAAALGAVLFSALTGQIGPSEAEGDPGFHFVVIHQVILPSIVVILLGVWLSVSAGYAGAAGRAERSLNK
jgi:hypothetical protein